jgi:hypothetical protein
VRERPRDFISAEERNTTTRGGRDGAQKLQLLKAEGRVGRVVGEVRKIYWAITEV